MPPYDKQGFEMSENAHSGQLVKVYHNGNRSQLFLAETDW